MLMLINRVNCEKTVLIRIQKMAEGLRGGSPGKALLSRADSPGGLVSNSCDSVDRRPATPPGGPEDFKLVEPHVKHLQPTDVRVSATAERGGGGGGSNEGRRRSSTRHFTRAQEERRAFFLKTDTVSSP